MKLAAVVWYIFKAHPAFHQSSVDLKAGDRDELHKKYLDRYYAIHVVLSWYAPLFYEASACDACNHPDFSGFNPAEVISPCKDAMRAIQMKKDAEAQAKEALRRSEEVAREKQNQALLEELQQKQQDAETRLQEMKLKQMKEMESQFKIILDQSIATAGSALQESRKKFDSFRTQIEEDLVEAARSMVSNRVKFVDYTRTEDAGEEIGCSASTIVNQAAFGGLGPGVPRTASNTATWVPGAVSRLRVLLQGRSPNVIYVDAVDDEYNNCQDFSRCCIPLKGRTQADLIEHFIKELLEQCPLEGPQHTTILLRYPTAETGLCSA
ncbi:hypothetical protein FOZ63_014671, partial [Perkinsus olseni]